MNESDKNNSLKTYRLQGLVLYFPGSSAEHRGYAWTGPLPQRGRSQVFGLRQDVSALFIYFDLGYFPTSET